MPDEHARLSPSASSRWLSCPASVLLVENLTQDGVIEPEAKVSEYALEGTKAHDLAFIEGSLAFGLSTRAEYTERMIEWTLESGVRGEALADMKRHVRGWIDLLRQALDTYPDSHIMLERRVATGVPSCWGTADAIVYSPRHVHVLDLKYGQGVAVDAHKNPQLMLYGLGGLEEYGDLLGPTEDVLMTIYQPRTARSTSVYHVSADELRAWRENEVLPVAEAALKPGAKFGPSASACRFCPVAGDCRARMGAALDQDFGEDPALLSPEELSAALARIPGVRSWCDAVEKRALERVYNEGKPIPGWKVVRSNGRRSVPEQDIPHAIQILIDEGYTADQVARFSLKPLGALERLVGKKELSQVLAPVLVKSQGNPSLVPESDNRPAINPNEQAAKDFDDDDE